MKKILIICVSVLSVACNSHDGLWDEIDGLKDRVDNLEERISTMNTNISALQALANAIEQNNFITSVTPLTNGYRISFLSGSPIDIYHGEKGETGASGATGEKGDTGAKGDAGDPGNTPVISIALDESDNIYYWTLNGTWLTVEGRKGRDRRDRP